LPSCATFRDFDVFYEWKEESMSTIAPETPCCAGAQGQTQRELKLAAARPGVGMDSAEMPGEGALETALASDLDGSFERVVRQYQDRLFSFALRLTRNNEDAEEVAQDAFVRAYRALKRYPAERIQTMRLKAWLYRVTLNVARNRLRGKHPSFVSLHSASPGGDGRGIWEADDESKRPDSHLEKKQGRADLASLVTRLPDRYRTAIILRYVEGLHVEEVAEILKQPLGTTKSNLHRAVNALRAAISASRRVKG
jgi:RNA polymerase sigma-70 factor, ECF subfamily